MRCNLCEQSQKLLDEWNQKAVLYERVIEAAKDARDMLDRWAKEPKLHMLIGAAIVRLSGPLDALLAAESEEG